jgi:putative membrane protein
VALILLSLWLSWRNMRFRIDASGVYLRSGILAKRERSAAHDRVQSVDISLPFIPRLLGLASLVFDVAGGSDSNITISYLSRKDAEALREEILGHLRQTRSGQADGRGLGSPQGGQGAPQGGQGAVPGTAQGVAQSGPHAAGGAPAAAPGAASAASVPGVPGPSAPAAGRLTVAPTAPLGQRLLSQRARDLQQHAAAAADDLTGSLRELLAPYRIAPTAGAEGRLLRVPLHRLLLSAVLSTSVLVSVIIMIALLVGIIVVGIVISPAALASSVFAVIPGLLALVGVLRTELGRANFTVALTRDGLRVSQGLASTTNRIIPLDRIQAVKLIQPLLWRPAGWWRAEFTIASEGSDDQGQNVLLPVGSVDDVLLMLGLCLPDPRPVGIDARSLVLAGMQGPLAGGPEARAAEPAYRGRPQRSRWLDPVTQRRNAHALTGTLALIRAGRLSRTLELVPHARVQALSLRQGPIQRRLGLSTIALHLSPGPITPHFVHLPQDEAHHLFDRHVEVTRRAREELDAHSGGPADPRGPATGGRTTA